MTGTPILNKPQDLFSLLNLVNPLVFSDEKEFLAEYCHQGYSGKWGFNENGLARLVEKMKHFYVVRDRHEANIQIPPQVEQIYELEIDPVKYNRQLEAAKALNDYGILMLENALGERENVNLLYVITLILRKRQMMTWPAGIDFTDKETGIHFKCDVDQSVKIDRIIEQNGGGEWVGLIPEFANEGERVVLFSQFKQPLKEIERRLKVAGISVVRYDGDTPDHIANEVQIDFDRRYYGEDSTRTPKWQVVLAHYKKGGVGLNFTHATQMIILDEEWNPGKVDQAYGRIDRMGQTEETTVHVLRVKNSVDEWLAALIESKANMISGFEDQVSLAQELLDKMRSGEIL
jgi:SNF2 family DNA or RNA helicase